MTKTFCTVFLRHGVHVIISKHKSQSHGNCQKSSFQPSLLTLSHRNTSNQGPKRKRTFVFRYVAPPGECYYNTLLCCNYFTSSSVVSQTFSALIYQATFVPNFVSFATSIADLASPMEKNRVVNQSLDHPVYLMPREPKPGLRFGIIIHSTMKYNTSSHNTGMFIILPQL